jgi:hypothetical protein
MIEISCLMGWFPACVQPPLELGKMRDILMYWTTPTSITTLNVFINNIALLTRCILVQCTRSRLVAITGFLCSHRIIAEEHLLSPVSHYLYHSNNESLQVWQISEADRLLSLLNF